MSSYFKSLILKSLLMLFFIGISTISQAQYFGFKINSGNKSIRLDYHMYNNLVVIPVRINNVIPLNFVMDSGIRSTIITDKIYTDMLGLPHNRKIIINGPGDYNQLEAYVVTEVSLFLEGITGYDQSVLVLDKDYLQLSNILGTEVHGMIGYDLYNRFVLGFNFPDNYVTMTEPRQFIPPKNFDEIPLLIEDTKPYIWATVNTTDTTHVRVKLLIDTGASHSLLLKEDAEHGIKLPVKNINAEIGRGLGGPIAGKLAKIKSLSIGDYTFHNVVTSFPDPGSYPVSASSSERNGTIGGDILSRFNVYFDYRHGKLYLRKNHNYKKKFGYNMSGLTVVAEGERLDSFRVAYVRKYSPAEKADIRPGDYIISVAGYSGKELDLNAMYKIFNFKAGKKIKIYVRRDGDLIKKDMYLEDVI